MMSQAGIEKVDKAVHRKKRIYAATWYVITTYGHRQSKVWFPVRSTKIKPLIGGLVVGSVMTSEPLLLSVFCFLHTRTRCISMKFQRAGQAL